MNRSPPLLLAGLVAAIEAALYAAWCLYRGPGAAHDDANLYLWAVDLEVWLRAGAEGPLPPNPRGAPYPPLVPLLAALHFLLLDQRSVGIACAAGWPFVLLLGQAAYVSVRKERGVLAGLAAAALAPLPLWSLGHPGSFHIEIPLACCVLLGVAARPGLRAGLAIGLALLVKWTAGLFLLPTLLRMKPGKALLAVLGAMLVAGPWYLGQLPELGRFVSQNLGGAYTGEQAPLSLAWSFYPSRLVTGVLGTPLLLLFLAGVLRSLGPKGRRLPRACLLALVVGMLLLTLQPYRDQRYLLAGLGLLSPIFIEGAALGGRWLLGACLAAGLWWQTSWLLDGDPLGGLQGAPVEIRDGLRRQGLRAARDDLWPLRWRLSTRAPDPLKASPPLRLAARAVDRLAPDGPLVVHLVNLVGRSGLDRLRVELATVRGPGVQLSAPGFKAGELEAALQEGDPSRWLPPPRFRSALVVERRSLDQLPDGPPAWKALEAAGYRVLYRGGGLEGGQPAIIQVWGR